MKWHMYFGALLISAGLCSQGFGFELLDRMLGVGGGGCCEPKCGVAAAPACCPAKHCCRTARPCPPPCPPKCAAPCPDDLCCDLFGGLRDLMHGVKCAVSCPCPEPCAPKCAAPRAPKCAAPCAPKCAAPCAPKRCCKPACAPACPSDCCRGGLLDRLFSCNRGCAPAGCGAEAGTAVVGDDDAPVPPVPPVPETDPSAGIQKRQAVRPVNYGTIR
jgi:hypothetical protein